MAPAPMIAPWPVISLGTEWTVPMVPGLVSEIVTPEKSSAVSLPSRARRTMSLIGRDEFGELHGLAALDGGDYQGALAVFTGQVDRQAQIGMSWCDGVGLAVDLGEVPVHVRELLDRLNDGVTQQVGEGDLAATGSLEVVVDDDPVVDHQGRRNRPDAGGGRDAQRGVHVLDHRRGRATQHLVLVGGRRGRSGCSRSRRRSGRRRGWGRVGAAAGAGAGAAGGGVAGVGGGRCLGRR